MVVQVSDGLRGIGCKSETVDSIGTSPPSCLMT